MISFSYYTWDLDVLVELGTVVVDVLFRLLMLVDEFDYKVLDWYGFNLHVLFKFDKVLSVMVLSIFLLFYFVYLFYYLILTTLTKQPTDWF